MPHYPRWRVAEPYRDKLSSEEHTNGVRILRYSHYVPAKQSAMSRALYEVSFLLSAVRAVWTLQRPDAILAVVPTLSDAVLARLLASRFGVPYGMIFQDMMGPSATQSGIAGGGRVAAVTSRIEAWTARRARVVATVAEQFIPYLVRLGIPRERITHLPNWTHVASPTADRTATRARLGWRKTEVIVLHAGNMGLKQGLEQVLAAARLALRQEGSVRFAFVGDGNQRRHLQHEAAGLPNVDFYPMEPESTFPDVLAAADVLLVSERASAVDMSLPSKITSYFVAGRPVVAAVPAHGATAQELKRSGGGLVVPAGEPQSLLDAVLRLRADHGLAKDLCEAAREYAARYLEAEVALARGERFTARLLGEAEEPPSPVR